MNVLSLFDGISAGQVALKRAGIEIDTYYASEIDQYAISITQKHFPNTVQLGSVTNIDTTLLPKIDMLIGGSPCTNFSNAGKRNGMTNSNGDKILNLDDYLKMKQEGIQFEGQSFLFWEYVRILRELKPKYFLLENVKMKKEWQNIISKELGVEPVLINSNLVSAQNRPRLYWTNIPNLKQPDDRHIFLKDIKDENVHNKYYLSEKLLDGFNRKIKRRNDNNLAGFDKINIRNPNEKVSCLTARYAKMGISDPYIYDVPVNFKSQRSEEGKRIRTEYRQKYNKDFNPMQAKEYVARTDNKVNCLTTSVSNEHIIMDNDYKLRKLTPTECEKLQTFDVGYTEGLSNTRRYHALGNSWTVDVIVHIFKGIKNE